MKTIDRVQVEQLREALAERGATMEYFDTGGEALARLQELVPLGAEVGTGTSTTLDQIGFTDWLTAMHTQGKLRSFRSEVHHVGDPAERAANRRRGCVAEYFLGSVNALSMDGVAVVADAAGTRVGGYVYPAQRVIWVVGVNKVVPTVEDAVRRLWEVALPAEDASVKVAYGSEGSHVGKLVLFYREAQRERIRMLLVGQELGF